jgi:hypothetical protein
MITYIIYATANNTTQISGKDLAKPDSPDLTILVTAAWMHVTLINLNTLLGYMQSAYARSSANIFLVC